MVEFNEKLHIDGITLLSLINTNIKYKPSPLRLTVVTVPFSSWQLLQPNTG